MSAAMLDWDDRMGRQPAPAVAAPALPVTIPFFGRQWDPVELSQLLDALADKWETNPDLGMVSEAEGFANAADDLRAVLEKRDCALLAELRATLARVTP